MVVVNFMVYVFRSPGLQEHKSANNPTRYVPEQEFGVFVAKEKAHST